MITTQAWILKSGERHAPASPPIARLHREQFTIPELTDYEVLVEPLYGCWEGNMNHALRRDPIDICVQRREEKVVIGNAGVVRVLRPGKGVTSVKPNDLCLVFCNGIWDCFGYPVKVYGYDAPGTIGLLAKQTKLHEKQLIGLPENSRHTMKQWAAFSLRFITAWANWRVAYGCWRVQAAHLNGQVPTVWGWGGGVTLAELMLAKHSHCSATMISSQDERLKLIAELGLKGLDRRSFRDLHFDRSRYEHESGFRNKYLAAEEAFLDIVSEQTGGRGVSIFIDFIGLPVFRATLKSLGRPGVITTAGWKAGMDLSVLRAIECMGWHTHVHTHYARYDEAREAVAFAEENSWMPPLDGHVYDWEDIAQLAEDYAVGKLSTYFPVFRINDD
jgi:NADPH:quinone reductase-like Zn-dependent oxidoreductase